MSTKLKKSKAEIVSIAVLDENNVYQGVSQVMSNEVNLKECVEVPADCDLAIGGYYWDDTLMTFLPTTAFVKQQQQLKRDQYVTTRHRIR
jgi:hypothetical protein